MRTIVICTLIVIAFWAVFSLIAIRPYLPDLWRYAWWRLTSPPAVVGKVVSGDATIHYRISGQGAPLVLLHGGLSSSIDWYALLPGLSRQFQVISIDSRGHGQSTLGHQPYTYHLLADDVIAVLDELDIRSADVAGWSDGGNTALMLALYYSERIKRVVAISANAHLDGLTPEASDHIDRIDPERPPLIFRVLYIIQSPHPSRLIKLRSDVLALWQSGLHFTCEDLNRVTSPVLLIIGQNDDVALDHAQEMRDCLRQADLHVLPAVGHTVPQSAPERVLALMLDFLTKH